jgi:hypothetical protein
MITVNGPLFDGRAARAAEDFCDDWERDYTQEAERAVHQRLDGVLRHPTGNYQAHIQTRRDGDGYTVDDSRIIYGPWLEGTGSRNRTTRFKGYSTFRLVAQLMDARAESHANGMFRGSYLRRMR